MCICIEIQKDRFNIKWFENEHSMCYNFVDVKKLLIKLYCSFCTTLKSTFI